MIKYIKLSKEISWNDGKEYNEKVEIVEMNKKKFENINCVDFGVKYNKDESEVISYNCYYNCGGSDLVEVYVKVEEFENKYNN